VREYGTNCHDKKETSNRVGQEVHSKKVRRFKVEKN